MNKPYVYKPKDALLNYDAKDLEPPKPKYESRKAIFKKEEVQKITKGQYGREK